LQLFDAARGKHSTASFANGQRIISKPGGRAHDQNNFSLQEFAMFATKIVLKNAKRSVFCVSIYWNGF
jgi:hypothetical protein